MLGLVGKVFDLPGALGEGGRAVPLKVLHEELFNDIYWLYLNAI